MTQDRATSNNNGDQTTPYQTLVASSYYSVLGVHPSASAREIRQAYRDLSKLYHPDTTSLPRETATTKFHQLNEAYATLSNPERRSAYDQKIGYSRIPVVQTLPTLNRSATQARSTSSSAYLDPTDRPLSPGEVFALFILGLTFLACLVLAITIGFTRGEAVLRPVTAEISPAPKITAEPVTSQSEVGGQSESPAIMAETKTDKAASQASGGITSDSASKSINSKLVNQGELAPLPGPSTEAGAVESPPALQIQPFPNPEPKAAANSVGSSQTSGSEAVIQEPSLRLMNEEHSDATQPSPPAPDSAQAEASASPESRVSGSRKPT